MGLSNKADLKELYDHWIDSVICSHSTEGNIAE